MIVSSCRPIELMLGKIIGVGLVGITQIAIWVVFLGIGSSIFGAAIGSIAGLDTAAAAGATTHASAANSARTADTQLAQNLQINHSEINMQVHPS